MLMNSFINHLRAVNKRSPSKRLASPPRLYACYTYMSVCDREIYDIRFDRFPVASAFNAMHVVYMISNQTVFTVTLLLAIYQKFIMPKKKNVATTYRFF